jgi:1,4-alpha-glucan branching enzyme
MDLYSFYTGTNFKAYEYLGAHNYGDVTSFRVYAPNADSVDVIGEWSEWVGTPMHRVHDGNFWEADIWGAKEGMMYKYRITSNGISKDHSDPYAYAAELRPGTASVIQNLDYIYHDDEWMSQRSAMYDKPLNIYEIHFGSWKKCGDCQTDWYTYYNLGDILIPYLKENGYNYVEIMPLAEHPCDESWGYQETGFFSATSRYGNAKGLMHFVEQCHKNGIGVILDFVCVHFAADDFALASFDGSSLYEYPSRDVGVSEWGSLNFMHSRGEVQSFLQSAADFWLTHYHFDGLRFDAISNLIYWQGDKARGVNGNTVRFLQNMTDGLKKMHKGIILAAEDSTSYPNVTKSVSEGGLGFDYKWDMGWMNDTLDYFKKPSAEKASNYSTLTFSMHYYYDERFLLPFSHDEVVHGKATIVQKMNGDYEYKFPAARAMYMYMYAHPGKKLNFMGNELGHMREWDEKREMDWDLLKYPLHSSFSRFIHDLNHVYIHHREFWERDFRFDGFNWLSSGEYESVYAFERASSSGRIVAVFNFSDKAQSIELPVLNTVDLYLILASDRDIYGGVNVYPDNVTEIIENGRVKIEIGSMSGRLYNVT